MNKNKTFTGKVKFFNKERGYGFIVPDPKQEGILQTDLFYHAKNQLNTQDAYKTEDRVQFTLNPNGRKGAEAINVSLLS